MTKKLYICFLILVGISAIPAKAAKRDKYITLETNSFRLSIDTNAVARSLILLPSGKEMLDKKTRLPILTVTQDRPFNNETKLQHPNTQTIYKANHLRLDNDKLIVGFDTAPYEAVIAISKGDGYLTFTLEDFLCDPTTAYPVLKMDLPPVAECRILQLPIKKRRYFGEWLNVMWDDQAAICVAGCDPYTLIWHEDCQGTPILTADLARGRKLRGGSAAIIAGAGKDEFLDAMDTFEQDFGLPRGVRDRRSPLLNRSIYWTSDVTLQNIDEHIALAKKAGLEMMLFYYPCFLKSQGYMLLGDYDIREDYPNGYDDIRAMLAKVKAAGITPGLHTLQTHIGICSRYVTPTVDARLNRTRRFTLKKSIPAEGEVGVIHVEENPVDAPLQDGCRVLAFGGEAFCYESYTTEQPYTFTGVKRGHYDTQPISHPLGEIGGILDISEYGGSSIYINQDNDLQDEIAIKIAALYDCGFEFIYFDGSEGVNKPTGINVSLSQYRVISHLNKEPIFTEGAAKSHFGWHFQTGANAFDIFPPSIFKEMILKYPYAEAQKMKQNMTRVDFGWWYTYADVTPDMWEFGESKAVECNCPVAIMFNLEDFKKNPYAEELLQIVHKWEDYRRAHTKGF